MNKSPNQGVAYRLESIISILRIHERNMKRSEGE